MSINEELILFKWRELNELIPPAEHLNSAAIKEKPLGIKDKPVRRRHRAKNESAKNATIYRGNEERNRNIIQLHTEKLSNLEISETLKVPRSIVVAVINRYRMTGNNWSFAIKEIDRSEIHLIENVEGIKANPHTFDTHIVSYKDKQGLLKHRYYLVMKALLEDQREYFPASELMLICYTGKEIPKTVKECFRKYMRELKDILEDLNLTLVNKPYHGYRLVGF